MFELNEEDFNTKIRKIIKNLILNDGVNWNQTENIDRYNDFNIFLFLNEPAKSNWVYHKNQNKNQKDQDYVSLTNLRFLLMANFIAKLLKKSNII